MPTHRAVSEFHSTTARSAMKSRHELRKKKRYGKPAKGKVKYALLGWMIGLPLPIIIILLFWRGCDF
jgi:hypothetical protein